MPEEKILCILNSSVCYIKSFNPEMSIYEIGKKINSDGIVLDEVFDIIHISINGDETIGNHLTKEHTLSNYSSFIILPVFLASCIPLSDKSTYVHPVNKLS